MPGLKKGKVGTWKSLCRPWQLLWGWPLLVLLMMSTTAPGTFVLLGIAENSIKILQALSALHESF